MRKKIIFIIFLAFFVFSGCVFKKDVSVSDNNSWEEEVLEVKECGMDGLRCCENEPACYYGQTCCVSPTNSMKNYCADSCDFGKENKFCREDDPKCDSGFVCSDDYCVQCGKEKDLCCADDTCADGLICYQSHCVRCGLSGNPCCDGICLKEGKRLECSQGLCRECGFGGKSICRDDPHCNPYHLENNGKCLKCGKENLPCCDSNEENDQVCLDNLKCEKGFCTKIK